jgi:DNA mismatch repair ATPase MutL
VIPLLIATVVPEGISSFNNVSKFLNSLGIEINYLSENQIVIKTFPEFLDVFRNHKLIQLLFNKLANKVELDSISFQDVLEEFGMALEKESYSLSEYQINKMLENIPEELLNESNIKIVLDEEIISKLFKG